MSDATLARAIILGVFAVRSATAADFVPLFDGRTLDGWETIAEDRPQWRVQNGVITGGSLTEEVPHNTFLATKSSYKNFDLRLKVRLTGTEGFINSGIQFRSVRVPGSPEMSGYQADAGKGWWGKLYDESRRNTVIDAPADSKAVDGAVKVGDWNEYRIVADGPQIRTWLNGVPAARFFELDETIPREGHIAIQVHGGGKAFVEAKDILIRELPDKDGK